MPDSVETLIRIDLKVERAKKHILDLEAEWRGFLDGNPYGIGIKDDVNTGERSYYIERTPDIPASVPLITGDALQNLRSALDHLAYHLASVGSKGAASLSRVYFPIAETATKYQSEKAGKIKGMRQDAVDAIDAIEPYGSGKGSILWILHTLNNFDKHRLLVTALADLTGHTASPSYVAELSAKLSIPPGNLKRTIMPTVGKRFPLKAGDVLVSIPKREVNEEMTFLVNPAFAEPKIVEGWPIIQTLHEMTDFVRTIIFRFAKRGLI